MPLEKAEVLLGESVSSLESLLSFILPITKTLSLSVPGTVVDGAEDLIRELWPCRIPLSSLSGTGSLLYFIVKVLDSGHPSLS